MQSTRVLVATVMMLSLPWPTTRAAVGRNGCGAQCNSEYYDTAVSACGTCAATADANRLDCLDLTDTARQACVEGCPGFAGRCAITRGCVNDCRGAATQRRAVCNAQFAKTVRASCRTNDDPGRGRRCLAAGRSARRACIRDCRHGSLLTATATAPAASPQQGSCQHCQAACVRNIVGHCYDDCVDDCEGDGAALRICKGACRNARCTKLKSDCVARDVDEGVSNAYEACCTACGECADDVDCVPTTTSTSTSSTTSSSTAVSTSTSTTSTSIS